MIYADALVLLLAAGCIWLGLDNLKRCDGSPTLLLINAGAIALNAGKFIQIAASHVSG